MIKFRQKAFNEIADGAWKGAAAGLSLGTILGSGGLKLTNTPGVSKLVPKSGWADQRWSTSVAGAIVGAALGTLVGTVKEVDKIISGRTADARLMKKVVEGLKGFEEGKDFTRDPKTATLLRTKVCIAFTRNAAEFKVLVNTEGDKRLKSLSEKVIRKIPTNVQTRHQQASNKFNEIEITTVSRIQENAGLVIRLVTEFIEGGYPVYIIEVG